MFLLRTKNVDEALKSKMIPLKQLIYLKKKFTNKIELLNLFKEAKTVESLRFPHKISIKSENFVKYILGISLTNTNTNVYVTDIKGKVYFFLSAGSLGLTGKQKTRKPVILTKLLRIAIFKMKLKLSSHVAVHFKNFTRFYISRVLLLLKKHLTIELVKIYNNKPHNGCRPKKLMRKKRKRLSFR